MIMPGNYQKERGFSRPRSCKYQYLDYNRLQPLKMEHHIGN